MMKALSLVTATIDPQRPDVVKVWEVFLKHLHGTKVLNPDGGEVKLNMEYELMRLQRKNIAIKTEWLGARMSESDLDQIIDISKESFGQVGTFSKEEMRKKLQERGSGCVVARSQESNEILGFCWYFKVDGKVEIAGIARRPKATYLKIGDQLLLEVIKAQWSGTEMQLMVRKSNPAVQFYENWRFVKEKEIPGYYPTGPKEDAILMRFDWDAYKKVRA
jgi:ribosomal protein S18 acetylase RimI-like enzyme